MHMITDGRDTPPESAIRFNDVLEAFLGENPGVVASVSGRYYTMDRDRRWPRTQMGYEVIANHQGEEGRAAVSVRQALQESYAAGVTDEFVLPVAIETGGRDVTVQPGDTLVSTTSALTVCGKLCARSCSRALTGLSGRLFTT